MKNKYLILTSSPNRNLNLHIKFARMNIADGNIF